MSCYFDGVIKSIPLAQWLVTPPHDSKVAGSNPVSVCARKSFVPQNLCQISHFNRLLLIFSRIQLISRKS